MAAAVLPAHGPVRRRDVLIGAGRGALGLALVTLTTSACGSEPPPDVDDLRVLLAQASADTELARSAAVTAPRTVVPALTQVASERALHAQALADEISRTLGTVVPTTTPAAGTSTTVTAEPAAPPSVDDVVTALRTAADSAARSAAVESGYRAGLLGSIAAACTAAFTVALPTPEAPQ